MKGALVFALALTVCATGVWADERDDCNQSADPDRRIRGCTQVIERGEKETRKNRSFAYDNRGNAYYKMGEFDRAIADFTAAIALNPNDAIAHYNRGNAYDERAELDSAIADWDKAIAINPNYAAAYGNRGIAYRKMGEFGRAIADYTKAIKINPNDADFYTNRGVA